MELLQSSRRGKTFFLDLIFGDKVLRSWKRNVRKAKNSYRGSTASKIYVYWVIPTVKAYTVSSGKLVSLNASDRENLNTLSS